MVAKNDPALAEKAAIVAQGVSVDGQIMSGQPCVAGTRLPTSCIRSFVKAGFGVDAIIEEYPWLLPWQIADALAWEMRPAKDRKAAIDYPDIQRLQLGKQED